MSFQLILTTISICIMFQSSSAQDPDWIDLNIVGEYRVLPINIDPDYTGISIGPYYNQDQHLQGQAFGIDISKNIFKQRIFIEYGLRLRNDQFYFEMVPSSGISEIKKAWF